MSALKEQIGGNHYKRGMQPVELFAKLHLNPFQANIIKYISRYRYKNGIEDLRKAKHFAELAEELSPFNFSLTLPSSFIEELFAEYVVSNELNETESKAILSAISGAWKSVAIYIKVLIDVLESEKSLVD